MKRAHGLVSLAVLHHVTVGIALLAMLAQARRTITEKKPKAQMLATVPR